MTGYTHDGPQILDADASWDLVEGTHVARLAVSVGGEPDIYPVTVRAHARTLAFRTVPGTKLATIATNQRVALEWDAVDDDGAWSVVARGTAHRLRTEHELDALGVDTEIGRASCREREWMTACDTASTSGRRRRQR